MEIINWTRTHSHLAGQCLLIGVSVYVSLKFLLPALLLLHVVASYVYLGNSPVWDFVSTTSQNLLAPFKGLGLLFGKVDVAPLIAIGLIIGVLYYPVPGLIHLLLDKHQLTIWPR